MIVCCCFGTTDREIRAAYSNGAANQCPAGQGCGSCVEVVRAIAAQSQQHEAGSQNDEQREPGRGERANN